MGNFYTDNEDLRFYVEKWMPWASMLEVTELGDSNDEGFSDADEARAFYADILELVGGFVANEVAPKAAAIDKQGVAFADGEVVFPPALQGIFDQIAELGLHRMCLPRELGGLNCPAALYFITNELFARADPSIMTHYGFHGGIAMAMLMVSLREGTTTLDATGRIAQTRFAREIEEIASGQEWGSMDITEPDAGSDMAALRTRAEQDDEGNWFVTGSKIFITSGHGKYHFVIARTEEASDPSDPLSGLRGLSFFLVPAYQDTEEGRVRLASVAGIEEKLGHHASATATVVFDRTPAHLIGERGEGFRYMLLLMNTARVGVGMEAIGQCEAAFRLARAYAAERRSMGKTIDRHEMIADYLDEMQTDIAALRALAMEAAFNEEMSQKLEIAIDHRGGDDTVKRKRMQDAMRRHRRRARHATPLLKYLASEKAVSMARMCLQIHGGVGYTTEYGAEKLLRDALVMPIYEGTSQIQALMAMKDTLTGIMKNPQGFVARVAQTRWRSLSARDPLERKLARLTATSLAAQRHLLVKTAAGKLWNLRDKPLSSWTSSLFKNWDPKRDFAFAMLHAERLTRILADEAIANALWRQTRRFPERRELLQRWLERAEPRARWLVDEIQSVGGRVLESLAEPAGDQQRAG